MHSCRVYLCIYENSATRYCKCQMPLKATCTQFCWVLVKYKRFWLLGNMGVGSPREHSYDTKLYLTDINKLLKGIATTLHCIWSMHDIASGKKGPTKCFSPCGYRWLLGRTGNDTTLDCNWCMISHPLVD